MILHGSIELKFYQIKSWWIVLIISIITVIFGIIVIISPFETVKVNLTVTGFFLIADGIIGITITIMTAKFIDKIQKIISETNRIMENGDEE